MSIRSLSTLIVSCSAFLVTNNTLWVWHYKCNMSLWCCSLPFILFIDDQKRLRANVLAQQLQSCLIFSTRKKIDYILFVSI